MIPEKIGRYEIERELGRGGMAVVYLARDPNMKRQVAVKVLPRQFTFDPQFRVRFAREAQVIAALDHPAIVPIYDADEHEGQPFIVMRYMPGGTLAQRLQKEGALSIAEASAIFQRIGSALEEAHAQGIVHRDLKPANILFDQRGDASIADFGIVKVSEATAAYTGSALIGTPGYMSPEQARGDANIDKRSDIYALGVILYEMLTGELPYQADTPMGIVVKHILEPVPNILQAKPDLPKDCETIVTRAMAKEPEARFASANEMATTLVSLSRRTAVPPAAREEEPATEVVAPRRPPQPEVPPRPATEAPPPRRPVEPIAAADVKAEALGPKLAGQRRVPAWAWIAGCLTLILCAGVLGGLGLFGAFFSAIAGVTPTPMAEVTAEATLPASTATAEAPAVTALPEPELANLQGSLAFGETAIGSVAAGTPARWRFTAAAGDVANIVVYPLSEGLDVTVDVLDRSENSILPDGEVDQFLGAERISNLVLASSDDYLIVVSGFDGSEGEFELALLPAAEPQPIAPGDSYDNRLLRYAFDDYSFLGEADAPVTIVVEPDSRLDAVIEVFDASGSLIVTQDSSFGREEYIFTPAATGNYLIRVRGYADTAGSYTISLIAGGVAGTAGSEITATDTLAEDSEHFFPFEAQQGNVVSAVVDPEGGLDVVLGVYNDDTDEQLDEVDASPGHEELVFTVPEDGRYYFLVTGFEGQTGSYKITLNGPPETVFELASGDTINGRLDSSARIDYTINGTADRTLVVKVAPEAGFDVMIEIYDAEDNLLASVDDGISGVAEQLSFTYPADGRYTIRVRGYAGDTGSFVMTLDSS